MTGIKRQIQKASSEINKQSIYREKKNFFKQRTKWIQGYSSCPRSRELSASSYPPSPERNPIHPRTVHTCYLFIWVSSGDAICLFLLLLDILTALQSSLHIKSPMHECSVIIHSCPALCNPMDCSLPGSSGHGISQARKLEWLPSPSPEDLPDPEIEPRSPAWQADSLLSDPPRKQSLWAGPLSVICLLAHTSSTVLARISKALPL